MDESILEEIKADVCPKNRLEEDQWEWARTLACCFYEVSRALAAELQGQIAAKLEISQGKKVGQARRVLIIPSIQFQALEVLTDQGSEESKAP